MLGWLLSSFVARRMRAMDFPDQEGPEANANTREVLESFLQGADGGARLDSAAQMLERERAIPWFRRPFFWEGYGLGLAVRHAATFSKKNPLLAHVGDGYRYMFYTGFGFYNGVAAAEGMPQLPAEGPSWADDPGYGFGRLLIAGGDSFARIAAGRRWNAALLTPLLEGRDADWQRGVWLGAGRALWFLYMRRFPFINEVLEGLPPEQAEQLASGLGVAITYTQLSEAGRILDDLRSLPARYHRQAEAGVRLCLAAASEDDPRFDQELASLPSTLARLRREACATVAGIDRAAPEPGARLFEALVAETSLEAS